MIYTYGEKKKTFSKQWMQKKIDNKQFKSNESKYVQKIWKKAKVLEQNVLFDVKICFSWLLPKLKNSNLVYKILEINDKVYWLMTQYIRQKSKFSRKP